MKGIQKSPHCPIKKKITQHIKKELTMSTLFGWFPVICDMNYDNINMHAFQFRDLDVLTYLVSSSPMPHIKNLW